MGRTRIALLERWYAITSRGTGWPSSSDASDDATAWYFTSVESRHLEEIGRTLDGQDAKDPTLTGNEK